MDSYGEHLKQAREEKGLELDSVAREISIEKKYLEGLENEDNGVFPGEAYLTGFLRNYASYLELDVEYLLKLYHNKQIQESPLPEGLLVKPKPKYLIPAIVIPIVLIIGIITTVSILLINKNKPDPDVDVIVSSKGVSHQYELNDTKFTQRVYKGDQFLIPSDNNKIILTVRDTLSSFGIDTPSGVYYVELSEESEIDVNGDNISDMIVYVSDISSTDETRGAEISLLLRHGVSKVASNDVVMEDIPFASEIKSKHQPKVIHEDNRAYPFTVNASFRGPCLFRDRVDNERSVETYFSRGEVFTATPHNGVRLWISNANTVKFTVIADSKSYDLDIGVSGQVYVEDIKWIKDTDGKYKLVVIELD